jgi:hypothetical protein
MNRTLLTVLVGVGCLVVGIAATAGIYESVVVSRLQSELKGAEAAAAYLRDSLDTAKTTIESCQQTVDAVSSAMTGYSDAYDASRQAINNFFDRYNFAAGDADYLFYGAAVIMVCFVLFCFAPTFTGSQTVTAEATGKKRRNGYSGF